MSKRVKYVEEAIFKGAKECKKFEDFFLKVNDAHLKTGFASLDETFDKEHNIDLTAFGVLNPFVAIRNLHNVRLMADAISFKKHFNDFQLLKPQVADKFNQLTLEEYRDILTQSKESSKKAKERVENLFDLVEKHEPKNELKKQQAIDWKTFKR